MKILDCIFCRLMYLYRKEEGGAIDSASNYLAVIIIVVLEFVILNTINLIIRPGVLGTNKIILFVILAPLYIVLSYVIKRFYTKRLKILNVEQNAQVIKFNLFTLWLFIVLLGVVPVLLLKL